MYTYRRNFICLYILIFYRMFPTTQLKLKIKYLHYKTNKCTFALVILFTITIFSGCVIGTPVNFGGMTGRAIAVILKLNFWKLCDHKKSFLLAPKTALCSFVQLCAALCSFVQLCAALCSFVQLCAALCSFVQLCAALCSFVQLWAALFSFV
jgi:hypothetical protein